MRSDRAVAMMLLLTACGSVNDLSIPSAPFATVRAHVDLAKVNEKAAGRPLLAGLVWGRIPSVPLLCYRAKGDAVIDANCPDPFGFFASSIDVTIAVDPSGDGHLAFVLDHLPSANVLIGTDDDHVAYASIVIVADENKNGAINVRAQQQNGGRGGQGGSTGTSTVKPDEILAASFVTLNTAQQRLAFREGLFDALKLIYPLPACETPPTGFSIIRTGAYADATAACELLGLDAPIEAALLEPADATALACRWGGNGGNGNNGSDRIQEAGAPANADTGGPGGNNNATPDVTNAHCLPGNNVVVIPAAATSQCRSFTAYALKGCPSDPDCETPEWDHTATPPEWWPCAK